MGGKCDDDPLGYNLVIRRLCAYSSGLEAAYSVAW